VRADYARQQLNTTPYPPAELRTNWPVSNLAAFYEAFDVKPGDKLYRPPEDRVTIW